MQSATEKKFAAIEEKIAAVKVLGKKMEKASTGDAITIISEQEQMKGLLARIAKAKSVEDQERAYAALGERLNVLASFVHLPWDREAAAFHQAAQNGHPDRQHGLENRLHRHGTRCDFADPQHQGFRTSARIEIRELAGVI